MTPPTIVLAVYPHYRGFGWVAFEGVFAPYDWGLVSTRRDKNRACLRKLEKLIERLKPETLVLEAFERETSARRDRVTRLCRGMQALAADRGLEVAIYTRGQVKASFAGAGAITRQEIAEAVARHVDAFRHRLPPPRRPWQADDERLSLFMAGALVLTHYAYGANTVFEDLKGAD